MATAVLPLALSTPAWAATTTSATVVQPADGLCTVTANSVRYRTGPGTGYTALGLVYAGTLFFPDHTAPADRPKDGTTWVNGSIVQGASNVWIRQDYLSCQ
ncbi:hypothetical protein [Amycolatopsis saalfeldensis]|nr:hypothetical protein [Amycolatopsis saalfeldensis]